METAATCILYGLVLSAMYILVALGFALLLSILSIFNFAHGTVYMVGAFVTYGFVMEFGINPWLAAVLSMVIVGSFGLFLEKYCFRPFGADINSIIIITLAIILVLTNTVNIIFGGQTWSIPAFVTGTVNVGFTSISVERLVTFAIGAVLLVAVTLFIHQTKTGQQMRAVGEEREGAALQGISINRIAAIATVIACALAALAGSLLGALLTVSPYMGDAMLLNAIQVVILGGLGSIFGILFGGLIIGFLNATLPVFYDPGVAQTVAMAVIILVLLLRPKGFFGHEVLA